MVRSLSSSKKASNKSVLEEIWTKGEEFSFKSSPTSSSRTNTSRSSKNVKDDLKTTNLRKTLYAKKVDTDISLLLPSSPISRRTRRQSMAFFPKIDPNKPKVKSPKVSKIEAKTRLTRTKSENIVSKKVSLTVKKSNIELNESVKKLSRMKSENAISKSKAKLPPKGGSSKIRLDESNDAVKQNKKVPPKATKSTSELNETKAKLQRTKSENIVSKSNTSKTTSISSRVKKTLTTDLNKSKTRVSRTKSENTLSKPKDSRIKLSPRIKLLKLDESAVSSHVGEQSGQELLSKMSLMKISKNTFYTSPERSPKGIQRRKSMSKLVEVSLSPKKTLHHMKKTSPSPKKTSAKSKASEKSQKTLQKPIKRLSVSTPSHRPPRNKRLTRSAAKKLMIKKVQICARSPTGSERFMKTPIVSRAGSSPAEMSSVSSKKRMNPFTPMPDEPSVLLRRTMKLKVASAKRKATILSKAESPCKSLASSRIPIRSGLRATQNEDSFESSSGYDLPPTPLSSRKSSVSFRQLRDSVRDSGGGARYRGTPHALLLSTENLVSSTPVRGKLRRSSGHSLLTDDHRLVDISNVSSSTAADSSRDFTDTSFTKSFVQEHRHSSSSVVKGMDQDVSSMTDDESDMSLPSSPQQQPQQKKSYCSLM